MSLEEYIAARVWGWNVKQWRQKKKGGWVMFTPLLWIRRMKEGKGRWAGLDLGYLCGLTWFSWWFQLVVCGTEAGGEELLMAAPGFKASAPSSKTWLSEGYGYCDATHKGKTKCMCVEGIETEVCLWMGFSSL